MSCKAETFINNSNNNKLINHAKERLNYLYIFSRKNITQAYEERIKEFIIKKNCRENIIEVCQAVINKNIVCMEIGMFCICQLFKFHNFL